MNLSASTFSQNVKVSLDLNQVSVKEFLRTVQQQTGINFLCNANLLEGMKKVSVRVENEELDLVLKKVLSPNGLTFVYEEGTVIIKKEDEKKDPVLKYVVGTVRDEKKIAIPGVTVILKGASIGTSTDVKGEYKLYISDVIRTCGFNRPYGPYEPYKPLTRRVPKRTMTFFLLKSVRIGLKISLAIIYVYSCFIRLFFP